MLHCFAAPLLGLVAIHPVQAVGGCSTPSFAETPGSPFLVEDHAYGPQAVVSADFDLDGRPDLAVATTRPDELHVLLGDGMGGFTAHGEVLVLGDLVSLETGDFNRDGKPDLLVVTESFPYVLLGDGLGGLVPGTSIDPIVSGVRALPVASAVGDLNLDGKLDVVLANDPPGATPGLIICLGDGTWNVPQTGGSVGGVGTPWSVAIGDVELDGKPDLVVASRDEGRVFVLRGDGAGGFLEDTSPLDVPFARTAVIADLNLDGKPDLALGAVPPPLQIRLGDGSGEFPDVDSVVHHVFPDLSSRNGRVATIGDFNLDGQPDLGPSAAECRVHLGDGTGVFPASSGAALLAQAYVVSADQADFDLDGKLDVVVVQQWQDEVEALLQGVSVLLNTCDALPCTGTSLEAAAGSPLAAGDFPRNLAVGDFDHDGDHDLALVNDDGLTVRPGDGQFGFGASSTVVAASGLFGLAVADLDLDGHLDLAVGDSQSNEVHIRFGDGMGGFPEERSSTIAVGSPIALAVGDLDHDGNSDLVIITTGLTVVIRRGAGSGDFPDSHAFTMTTQDGAVNVAIGDLDMDGNCDLAFGAGDLLEIWFGDGAGHFLDRIDVEAGWNGAVAIADLDRDGKPDMAVTDTRDAEVDIVLGSGTRTFSVFTTVTVGDGPEQLSIADLNRDGNPDLFTSDVFGNTVTIRLGDGTGGFPDARRSTIPVGVAPFAMAVQDLDRDGKPDVAVANCVSDDVTVLRNACTANLAPLAGAGTDQTVECAGGTTAVTLDGSGSSDPNEDALAYSWSEGATELATGATPTVQLTTGAHTLTLTVTDPEGLTSTDEVTIDVVDTTAPAIALTTNVIRLQPANHKHVTFSVAAFASGATDGCDAAIDASDIVITRVWSDEPQNATGNGDGNTLEDIVIVPGCRSVRLRAERAENRNGRVYTIVLAVRDAAGNLGTAERRVFVPVLAGGSATDDGAGAGYTVDGCTP